MDEPSFIKTPKHEKLVSWEHVKESHCTNYSTVALLNSSSNS